MMRTIWKCTGLFYYYLSVPTLDMLNQTTLQQEIAMHIRSIVSPQYDCIFEQGFKNSLLPTQFLILLPHLLGQGIQNYDSSAMKQMFISCKFNSLLWPKKSAWIMLLLTHWKFKDVVSTICHFCAMTKLFEVKGLRRQDIIYLK